jgi:alpha-tubulin suppressor-like RCC1 family protein
MWIPRRLTRRLARRLVPPLVAATFGCDEAIEPPTASQPVSALDVEPALALAFRQVSAGFSHTCGVTTDGVAYCWGANGVGELGSGTTLDHTLPVRVRGGHSFRQISAGEFHTCAVTPADAAYCWGSNAFGQLGDGTTADRLTPVRVAGGLAFREVSAGVFYTCGVTTGHVAYCWGDNGFAQLGDGSNTNRSRPAPVRARLAFRQVSAGGDNTCGVTTDDVAYCWGLNDNGQFGRGTNTGPETCLSHPCSTKPLRVLGGLAFRAVTAGVGHSCGVTTSDVAYCWGLDHLGQLGAGGLGSEICDFSPCRTRPARVAGGLAFRAVSASSFNTCGVTSANVAYCWGENVVGQLGVGVAAGPEVCTDEFPCSTRPVRVVGQRAYRNVTVGINSHVCGATFGSGAFCWGGNLNGELGNGTNEGPEWCDFFGHPCSTKPVAVAAPRR